MSRKDPRPEPLTIGSSSGHRYRASSVPEAVYFDQLRLLGEESQNRHDYSGASTAAANYLHGQGMRRKGKSSWKDILKLKRKRAKLRSPPQLTDKVSENLYKIISKYGAKISRNDILSPSLRSLCHVLLYLFS